jgi:hypothetical protein
MVTKKAEVVEPDTKEPETKDTVEISDEELTAKIKAILTELLPGGDPPEPEAEPKADDGKPKSYRQEEAEAHNLVATLVEEFKKEFAGDDAKKDDKKEPETKPGPKQGGLKAWVQAQLWGIE